MSNNKMLIDASHPEETRVVVLKGGRVEEFDFESAARKLLRGNIYLAKVTRVEPSLQAAFIDYGGNRHGFLAFNEIHPDYYQIPVADRQALLAEDAADDAAEEAEVDERSRSRGPRNEGRSDRRPRTPDQGPGFEPSSGNDHNHDAGHDVGHDAGQEPPAHDHHDHDHHDHDHEAHALDVVHLLPPEAQPQSSGDPSPAADHDRQSGAHHHDAGALLEGEQPSLAAMSMASDQGFDRAQDRIEEPAPRALSETRSEPHPEPIEDAPRVRVKRDKGDDSDLPAEVVEVEDAATEAQPEQVESLAEEDALEELPSRPRRRPRSYKIQEVIKRRQVVLIQVVKEERGTKGAALTTYLSLAGRYTVLMPNTARGGGISRKITNPQDRKRLKEIADELEVPEGMGLIIRTAGAARTKQEIKRDFEYLLRLWESVRDLTLQSVAPVLVYEEGNLVKRSIRDLYSKEIDEIQVAGEAAHREALDFMSMLMPSHAKNVINYADPEPLFARYGIERQLAAMFSPQVTLKSGGYIVINQTEALVAIDVNSGKSTREYSIEETALNTNLEASDEIARQLKLRDLAGLIVIDFIDMEEKRNNRAVERRVKDALRFDRARIQIGRISHFGLMEMSRQRLRTGVLEGSSSQCPHCTGTGIVRSTESLALAVIRGIEDELARSTRTSLTATTSSTVALYILNHKRGYVIEMERRYGVVIDLQASDKMQGANFVIEAAQRVVERPRRAEPPAAVSMSSSFEGVAQEELDEIEEAPAEIAFNGDDRDVPEGGRSGEDPAESDDQRRGRRRRRPRRDGRPDDTRAATHGGQRSEGRGGETRGDHRGERNRGPRHGTNGLARQEGDFAPPEPRGIAVGGEPGVMVDAQPRAFTDAPVESADRMQAQDVEGGAGFVGDDDTARPGDDSNGRRGRRRGRRGGRRGRERGDGRTGDRPVADALTDNGQAAPIEGSEAAPEVIERGQPQHREPRPEVRPEGRRDILSSVGQRGGPRDGGRHDGAKREGGQREGGQREQGRRPRFRDREADAAPNSQPNPPQTSTAAVQSPPGQPEGGYGFAAGFAASAVTEPVAEPHLRPEVEPAAQSTHRVEVAAIEPVQVAAAAAPVPRSRRSEPTSGEPVIERLRVGPDHSSLSNTEGPATSEGEPKTTADDKPEPQRKGWWQRRFSGS